MTVHPGSRQAEREAIKARVGRQLERQVASALAHGEFRMADILTNAALKLIDEDNPDYFAMIARLKRVPVTIEEFVESPEFLGDQIALWPALRQDLFIMNPDILKGDTAVHEVLMGGATGIGKSFQAVVSQCYQTYFLTCLDKPQLLWNLSASTPIVIMFQSVSDRVTKRVLYQPFRDMFTAMPYTQKWLRYDKYKEQELHIDGGIQIVPALATVQAMVGQAIIGGIQDEVNFMNVIENSMTIVGNRGLGGKYDQAEITHTTISRRRKSRFISRGPVPGCLHVSSSTRYKNDFLDRRIEQVRTSGEDSPTDDAGNPVRTKVVYMRRKQYEVQPSDRYAGPTFRVLVGTDHWPTRILEEHETEGVNYPAGAQVEDVPEEYYFEFVNDPENALRDVIGVATDVITPFITQRHKVMEAVVKGRTAGLKQWVVNPNVDLSKDGMPQFIENNLPTDLDTPRFVHIDLALTGVGTNDRCGIAIVKVDGQVDVPGPKGVVERLPNLVVEMAVSIKPNKVDQIDIAEVRKWVMQLKTFYGLNIYMVTYDGFASKESIQLLRKGGIRSQEISMDRTTEPYVALRSAYYQNRISQIDNEEARLELVNLEMDEKKGQVTHPPRVGKDIADAICGACYAAATSRAVRNETTVSGTTRQGTVSEVRASGRKRLRPRPGTEAA